MVNDIQNETVLVVSRRGYKTTAVEDYRITNRGKGVITPILLKKTGNLIAIQSVTDLRWFDDYQQI